MEELRVEYKTGKSPSSFALFWSSPSLGSEQGHLPADVLCHAEAHILGSPYQFWGQPGLLSPQSIQLISLPSQLRAGEVFTFQVWVGDTFNNSVSGAADNLAFSLVPPSSVQARSTLLSVSEGPTTRFSVQSGLGLSTESKAVGVVATGAAPTRSGTHSLFSSVALVGGLSATYYDGGDLSESVSADVDATIDFSLGFDEVPAASLTAGTSYSIRWSGF
eukprot:250134-Rhodomonas_salina.1